MPIPQPAVIHLESSFSMVRLAAFTWRTGTGVAWLEPDYLEPEPGSRSAFHHWAGEVVQSIEGVVVRGLQGSARVIDAQANIGDRVLVPPFAAEGLLRMAQLLERAGTTWQRERVRVAGLLAEDLRMYAGVID